MELKEYLELAEKKAGKQTELAKILDISEAYIRMAKTGKRGLPDAVCMMLADYLEIDRLEIIAKSNLITEKDEKRRKVLESCISKAATIAAAALIFGGSSMTSSTAHAAMSENRSVINLYYVK